MPAPTEPQRSYFWRVAIATDTWWNVVTGGRLDETLSTRSFIYRSRWPWKALYWALDHLVRRHCESAIRHDALRAKRFAVLAQYYESH